MRPRFLSTDQIDHFINHGYVTVPDCFSHEFAQKQRDHAYVRLGYDPNDRTTWKKKRIHMAMTKQEDFEVYSPKGFAAAADLVGGVERIKRPMMLWTEGYIVNFNDGADRPWTPPSADAPGWHKDGGWFHHFLDSPEQGLLMIFVFSEIKHKGGGTFGALDSIGPVARFMAQHPEGIDPTGKPPVMNSKELLKECREFIEWTGSPGDIILMHPYMLHASSQNHSDVPRFITNPAILLNEPMNFNRENPDDFSPVERAVLKGLGVERFDFRPTSPRRHVVAKQSEEQKKLIEEEKLALARVK